MELLQVKVSKKQLEDIMASKQYAIEVSEDFDKVFVSENDEIIDDPDYDNVSLVRKFDGLVFVQCRSKFPFKMNTVITESLGYRPYAAEEGPYAQRVTYTLGGELSKEMLKDAEIVEL